LRLLRRAVPGLRRPQEPTGKESGGCIGQRSAARRGLTRFPSPGQEPVCALDHAISGGPRRMIREAFPL
ncbi:MAG: hypothetical protein IJH47_01860, partial [Oscillospiraceae bacterium]|nr:hypothetical protein [Oscillospiraceae bacterium]